jgi:hypothetical protein
VIAVAAAYVPKAEEAELREIEIEIEPIVFTASGASSASFYSLYASE